MAKDQEEVLWKDRTHHMWFPFSFTKYYIANERLYIERGLLKTDYDETRLYHITDLKLSRTLGQKIFGTGDILLYTKGDSNDTILLHNIKAPKETKKMLSELIEEHRRKAGVVGKEFYAGHMHGGYPVDLDGDGIPDACEPEEVDHSGF